MQQSKGTMRQSLVNWFATREKGSSYNDDHHACYAFPSREIGSHDQDGDCDRDGSNGQSEFAIFYVDDDNHELNGESQEEKEVKLEKSDVDLES